MKKDLFEKKEEQTVSKHNIFENYLESGISQTLSKATVKLPRIIRDDKGLVKEYYEKDGKKGIKVYDPTWEEKLEEMNKE